MAGWQCHKRPWLQLLQPALVPGLDYAGMDISDGSSASAAYLGLVAQEHPSAEHRAVHEDRLADCARETVALPALYRWLAEGGVMGPRPEARRGRVRSQPRGRAGQVVC